MRDVAARAGVGVGTVSRVLNGAADVAAPTRERVLAAIEAIGYRPDPAARRLSLGRTHAIGVIAPFFTTPSVVERLRGVTDVIGDSSYDLLICDVETPEQRAAAFSGFARPDRIDGLVVVSLPLSDGEAQALLARGPRTVLVDVAHSTLDAVAIDDAAGGRTAGEHLLANGHRDVGFVGDGEGTSYGFVSSGRRLSGLRAALAAAGAPAPLVALGDHGDAHRLARELLSAHPRLTAVFAASDVQAIAVVEAARELGLDVPGELSVIGFDDIEIAAALGLTTVRQPLRESGRIAAQRLVDVLAGAGGQAPEPMAREPLALTLVQRATVSRSRPRDAAA